MKCIGRELEVQKMQKNRLLPISRFMSRQRFLYRNRVFWPCVVTGFGLGREFLGRDMVFLVSQHGF